MSIPSSKRQCVLLALWLVLLGPVAVGPVAVGVAAASQTDPYLALTAGSVQSAAGVRVIRLEGSFHAGDLIQLEYPLQVLVREKSGASYVRYDLADDAVWVGSEPMLTNGLEPYEAEALLSNGSPGVGGRLLLLAEDRMELQLPDSFPSGPAEALLYVMYEGLPVLSNAVLLQIPENSP